MIGVLAAQRAPERFGKLVLVGPSPRYIDDEGYRGGFTRDDIEELLESLDANFLGWSSAMAPAIMGNADRPELGEELTESFCRTDPDIAAPLRPRDLHVRQPRRPRQACASRRSILQCSDDVIAPGGGRRLRAPRRSRARVLVQLDATGHCPNLSAPRETIDAIRAFI